MHNPLMQQGIELMLYGIGTVFTFLALLILATSIMSLLLRRFSHAEPAATTLPAAKAVDQDKKVIAAITSAVHKYRTRHKK